MGSWVCVGSWTKHEPIYCRRAALERRDFYKVRNSGDMGG
jgi:hypothetical protein